MRAVQLIDNPWYKFWANPVEYSLPSSSPEQTFLPLTQSLCKSSFDTDITKNPVANQRIDPQTYMNFLNEASSIVHRTCRYRNVLRVLFSVAACLCLIFSILSVTSIAYGNDVGRAIIGMIFWLIGLLLFVVGIKVAINCAHKGLGTRQQTVDSIYRLKYMAPFAAAGVYITVGVSCLWLEFGSANRIQYEPPRMPIAV
jgi:hypothetical protein